MAKEDTTRDDLKRCLSLWGITLLPFALQSLLKGKRGAPALTAPAPKPREAALLPETLTATNPNIRALQMRALRILKQYAGIEAKVEHLRQIHREAVYLGHVESEQGWVVTQAAFSPYSFVVRLELDFYEADTLLFEVTFDFAIDLFMAHVTPLNHAAMEMISSEEGFEAEYREVLQEAGRG